MIEKLVFVYRKIMNDQKHDGTPYLTVSSMRVAMLCRRARLKTQIRLIPHRAGSGEVEQHQALCRSMKSSLLMSLCWSCCSRTLYAWNAETQSGDARLKKKRKKKPVKPVVCARPPDIPPPFCPCWQTGRSWPVKGCSESPAGNQAHCLQPDALPRPEEHRRKQKEQTRLFLLTATRQRCVLRNSPFSRHI